MVRSLVTLLICLLPAVGWSAPQYSYPAKAAPVAGDKVLIVDSQDSWRTKNVPYSTFIAGFMSYPEAGIPNSTGSAWGTSYSPSFTGTTYTGTNFITAIQTLLTLEDGATSVNISTFGLTFLDDTDASSVRTTVGAASRKKTFQQRFLSTSTLVATVGAKTKTPVEIDYTTADIGCNASDTLGISVKTSSSINGTYSEVGTLSLSGASVASAVDISSWTNTVAGSYVRIDLTGSPGAAIDCTVVLEGMEL